MASSWPEFKVDDLKARDKGAIAMGPFGSRIKVENFVSEGIPVIKGAQLHGAFVSDTNFDFLTEKKAEELSTSIAVRGDLVITHRGTMILPRFNRPLQLGDNRLNRRIYEQEEKQQLQ